MSTDSSPSRQRALNDRFWRAGQHVAEYEGRRLAPVEVLLLVRYRELLSGRVLELGCGAGRLLGYLAALGGEVHGVDLSAAMVERCRQLYPGVEVEVGDVAAIADVIPGRFNAILAVGNLLDIYDDDERRRVLASLRPLLEPDGRLIFSSHNLADLDGAGAAAPARSARAALHRLSEVSPRQLAAVALRGPRRAANRRRLSPLAHRGSEFAIVNDASHDYALLHYYIGRDEQERQLTALGYELLECLDPDGFPVGAGQPGGGPWLHYVARSV
jgi:SAM-dependent methyltransferase